MGWLGGVLANTHSVSFLKDLFNIHSVLCIFKFFQTKRPELCDINNEPYKSLVLYKFSSFFKRANISENMSYNHISLHLHHFGPFSGPFGLQREKCNFSSAGSKIYFPALFKSCCEMEFFLFGILSLGLFEPQIATKISDMII